MAYTSFTLRKSIGSGSALRPTTTDGSLRADGYYTPVPPSYLESTFSADVYVRGEVALEWNLQESFISLEDLSAYASGDFHPVGLTIRASDYGEPVTVSDGVEVITIAPQVLNSDPYPYFETYTDTYNSTQPYIGEGKWSYYTLFILYMDKDGAGYYENVAELSVQTPYDFGSTESLWKHIPIYYKELDDQYRLNTPGYTETMGPLYRYVELFGWELDKIRTTVFDTMRINDPNVIHSSAIDALAEHTGIEINRMALGTAKLRSLLNNIGYLRRTKGTENSVKAFISALTGCGVSVRTGLILGHSVLSFDVHPHRVNLISDPLFKNPATSVDNNGPKYRTWTPLQDGSRSYGWGVYVEYSSTPTTAPTISVANGSVDITLTPKSGATARIVIYSREQFTYNNALSYFGSAKTSHSFSPRFISDLTLLDLEKMDPLESASFADSWNTSTPLASFPKFSNPYGREIRGTIPSPTSSGLPSLVSPAFVFDINLPASGNTSFTFSEPLFEYENSTGEFFTGDNFNGGFIPNATGAMGDGLYDYHWGANSVDNSLQNLTFSYYTMDNYRSKKITEYIVENFVIPVNITKWNGSTGDYQINWDVLK